MDRDPVRGRRGTSEGQKRGMWNIRLFFRGECCGARHSWPVVSVDKTGSVVVPCCGACCNVEAFLRWIVAVNTRCGGGVWERECGCVTDVWDILINLRVETGEKHWRGAD